MFLYLTGRILFLQFTVRYTPAAQIIAATMTLLLPAALVPPVLPALGLLTALLTALVCYERWRPGPRS